MTQATHRPLSEQRQLWYLRLLSRLMDRKWAALLSIVLMALLVRTYQVFPGYNHKLYQRLVILPEIELLSRQSLFDQFVIRDTGLESGAYKTFGLPASMAMSLIRRVGHCSPDNAYLAFDALILSLSFAGGYSLLRREAGCGRVISVLGAYLFLVGFLVYGQRGFDAQIYGFMLLPAYAAVCCWYFRRCELGAWNARWLCDSALFVLVAVVNLFMIGYAFSMTLVFLLCLGAMLLLARYLPARRWGVMGRAALGLIAFVGVPYALYSAYIPVSEAMTPMPIDFFRGQGVDVISLVTPGNDLAYANLAGVKDEWNDYAYWGDGSNVRFNYLGVSLLLLAGGYLAIWRRLPLTVHALAIAGLLALILSLGPSLKVHCVRTTPDPDAATFAFEDYKMPREQATLSLHTDWIYAHLPLVQNMRAVHRWLLLTRLSLIVVAVCVLERVAAKHRILGVLIGAAMVAELLPMTTIFPPDTKLREKEAQFRHDVIEPLGTVVRPGSRVLFVSTGNDANDFLANILACGLRIRTYNVSGDKPAVISKRTWPPSILRANRLDSFNNEAYAALRAGLVDYIVLPRFSMRWNAYDWPPAAESLAAIDKQIAAGVDLNDAQLAFTDVGYAKVVTLSHTAVALERLNSWPFTEADRSTPLASCLPISGPDTYPMRGFHEYEAPNHGRWTASKCGFLLQRNSQPSLVLGFWNPPPTQYSPQDPQLHVYINGKLAASRPLTDSEPQSWAIDLPADTPTDKPVEVTLRVSGTYRSGGDARELGLILHKAELR